MVSVRFFMIHRKQVVAAPSEEFLIKPGMQIRGHGKTKWIIRLAL